jgi:hypothetical protein
VACVRVAGFSALIVMRFQRPRQSLAAKCGGVDCLRQCAACAVDVQSRCKTTGSDDDRKIGQVMPVSTSPGQIALMHTPLRLFYDEAVSNAATPLDGLVLSV